MTTIHESNIKKARKEHKCMASYWLRECGLTHLPRLTFKEYREIVKAKIDGWKILKGQPYIRQWNTDGGDIWVFKGRPEIHQICLKYDLYPEY